MEKEQEVIETTEEVFNISLTYNGNNPKIIKKFKELLEIIDNQVNWR